MMCRMCWMLLSVVVLVVGAVAIKFMIYGNTQPSEDGRTAIVLSAGERDLVLAEMRSFLVSVQGITRGVAENDMALVVKYARQVGMAAQGEVPVELMAKLPQSFRSLGLETHQAFDQLAMDAESLGDPGQVLGSLQGLMNRCIACHATYRLDAVAP